MAGDKETAFVLPVDAVLGSDTPVHFPNFPGCWPPGVPVAVTELGFPTLSAAREARDEYAPDLKEGRVDVGSAPMPAAENHVPLSETPPQPPTPPEPVEETG